MESTASPWPSDLYSYLSSIEEVDCLGPWPILALALDVLIFMVLLIGNIAVELIRDFKELKKHYILTHVFGPLFFIAIR